MVRDRFVPRPGLVGGWHFIDLYPAIYRGVEQRPRNFLVPQLTYAADHPGDAVLNQMSQQLEHQFGIHHATIQIELADTDEACALTPEHVV